MTLPQLSQQIEDLRTQVVAINRAVGIEAVQAQLNAMQQEAIAAAKEQNEKAVAELKTQFATQVTEGKALAVDVVTGRSIVIGKNKDGTSFVSPYAAIHPEAQAAFLGAKVPSRITFKVQDQETEAEIELAYEDVPKGDPTPAPDAGAILRARRKGNKRRR